jgi:hypothetical protein
MWVLRDDGDGRDGACDSSRDTENIVAIDTTVTESRPQTAPDGETGLFAPQGATHF